MLSLLLTSPGLYAPTFVDPMMSLHTTRAPLLQAWLAGAEARQHASLSRQRLEHAWRKHQASATWRQLMSNDRAVGQGPKVWPPTHKGQAARQEATASSGHSVDTCIQSRRGSGGCLLSLPTLSPAPAKTTLNVELPDHEDGSLSARLSEDGRSLVLTGRTCQVDTLTEISLPFGVSADDVDLELLPDGTLNVRASRKEMAVKIKAPQRNEMIASGLAEPISQMAREKVERPLATESPANEKVEPIRSEQQEEQELDHKFKIVIDAVAKKSSVVEKMRAAADEEEGTPHSHEADVDLSEEGSSAGQAKETE